MRCNAINQNFKACQISFLHFIILLTIYCSCCSSALKTKIILWVFSPAIKCKITDISGSSQDISLESFINMHLLKTKVKVPPLATEKPSQDSLLKLMSWFGNSNCDDCSQGLNKSGLPEQLKHYIRKKRQQNATDRSPVHHWALRPLGVTALYSTQAQSRTQVSSKHKHSVSRIKLEAAFMFVVLPCAALADGVALQHWLPTECLIEKLPHSEWDKPGRLKLSENLSKHNSDHYLKERKSLQ